MVKMEQIFNFSLIKIFNIEREKELQNSEFETRRLYVNVSIV